MGRKALFAAGLAIVVSICLWCGAAAAGENPAVADYKKFLFDNPFGSFATVEGNQPRSRYFQFLFADEQADRIYFCTGASKDVFKQLTQNNRISFCTWDVAANITLTVDGAAAVSTDAALRDRALHENPDIEEIYENAENPEFVLFYVVPQDIYSFSFEGGKEYVIKDGKRVQ
ncbi:MAG: pyridoxamine 5'-phosphate oxidase family protein [Planctomycetes bacterium]|nr:pyridoxamine 5'-phosphate oxidase family protein [Planctomycetota bacterium]